MSALLEQFKLLYRDFGQIDSGHFSEVYHDNVKFRDPVHEIEGACRLLAYLEEMSANLDFCTFEYLDESVDTDRAYIKWNMNFRHPRLGDETHIVRGISHIQFNSRIYYHEDVYDLGQMVYEHVPLVGGMTRWIKRRLAN